MASTGNTLPGLGGAEVLATGYVNFTANAARTVSITGLTADHIILVSLGSNVANCTLTGQLFADGILAIYAWNSTTGSGLNITARVNYAIFKTVTP